MSYLAIFYRMLEETPEKVHNVMLGAVMLASLAEALKIRAAFEQLGAGYKVNVHHLADSTEHLTPETIADVNAWLAANGFENLPEGLKLVR